MKYTFTLSELIKALRIGGPINKRWDPRYLLKCKVRSLIEKAPNVVFKAVVFIIAVAVFGVFLFAPLFVLAILR